ncbi:hypothetical protein ASG49_07925 [Marmoricola sp. Leaf446]|uniref:class I SAM-dependent methyltransferase n=1 Tax=Marmoricola sp. Leaf446 TaxID=1736379 RepID=UPI0006FD558D|nr:class I SAM-dependent methyltransferase [Marmoricola sp. Leaf446]KQT94737.1 hypothetical protein ASG49_07925 [Marmoricola sp. Leaf446]
MTTTSPTLRDRLSVGRARLARTVATWGPAQSPARRAADAASYWSRERDHHWRSNSHFRGSPAFADDQDLWRRVGTEHLEIVRTAARACGWTWSSPRVVDWGCGGGANAVAVAPHAGELVLVDLSARTLEECARQVAAVSEVPVVRVEVPVDHPEAALDRIGRCDLFLCFYVLELVPSAEHGARILQVAARALAPGGMAVVQFKYDDGTPAAAPFRRGYVRHLANMTTYAIPDFWQLAVDAGLGPRVLTLVPANDLDRRYGYLAMTGPATDPA